MKNLYFLITTAVSAMLLAGCNSTYFEVDTEKLQTEIYEPTAVKYEGLAQSTVLYLDHSTCVIDAVQNSQVFKALRPNLGQYCDTLKLIKGSVFESIPLDRQDNKVSEVLETIKDDISFADIRKAVFQICNGNQQAILISDCESYAGTPPTGRFLDLEPYMSEPFRDWLKKGNTIYIITEPYKEKYKGQVYNKKRFYFLFTNDYIEAPISHNMLGEIQSLLNDSICTLFKMTNSDVFVQFPKKDVLDENLGFDVEYKNGFEFISVENSWNEIREYVMKLDKYGEPLPEEKPVPLIKNLLFDNGENYAIGNIQIVATNITSRYLSLEDNTIEVKDIDISDGFILDKNAFRNNKLNVMLTDKIFTEGYLSDEFGGNLIRLDFVIKEVGLTPYDNTIFEWKSIWNYPEQAICVSKSIDNALRDVAVVPTNPNRRVIHTIFIKTEAYK
ncbi:MAG: hypothetical protein LBV74_00200 [Tannerella sp.]|jgi:hypothetical protein|nr:hypothetical protein [Tannerella sp.]